MPRFAAAFTPPDAIANLQATASGAGVSLTWDPTTLAPGDFVAYHVSRSIADGPFVELASQTDPADVDFVDFAAPLGVPLTYRLVQQSIDNLSDPTDAPTMVDACEFWLVLAATGQQIGFEIPNVESMASIWPLQSTEHEPLGRRWKLVETGELLGEEATVSALLLPDQANVARLLRDTAAAGASGDLLWKTPYGDVQPVVLGSIASVRGVDGRQTLTFRTVAVGADASGI